MKKLLIIGLSVMLPMASVMAAPSTDNLNGRSGVLGLPPFQSWAWQADGKTLNNSFNAGYAGFVDICENYLTKENLAKVKAAQAYSSDKMNNVLNGSGQSVSEWANSVK